MNEISEVLELIKAQGDAIADFKTAQDKKFDTLNSEVTDLLKKQNRPGFVDSTSAPETGSPVWYDLEAKRAIPVLEHKQRLTELDDHRDALANLEGKASPSVGRVLRGIAMGGRAHDADELAEERKALAINPDPSGGYTVAGALSNQWIDLLRSKMVLSQAGAMTVPMPTSTLRIAKLTGDVASSWHAENGDITESDPTFGSVNLTAKTVVCLVKLSLELSQDSANIEQMLERSIISSMAAAIDQAGLRGVTTNAASAPDGVFNLDGRNTVTSIGTPANWDFALEGMYELLADNVPLENIGALIGHPKLWKNQAKLKTGINSDETPLVMPADVQKMPKLWTTACPEAKAIIADWRDLLFGVRKDITVRVLTETFMGSNLQLALLAYARVDFQSARDESFCSLEGITY